MTPAAVQARGLGVRVGERWLFRAVDLSVAGGECLALTGSNGSGKSTMLGCLHGTREPTEGEVLVAGEAPDERRREFRALVSVVLDDSALFDEFTPRQHLDMVGVPAEPDLPDVPALRLSAGQRRRLLLLGAVERAHRVLLLDEPERALDVAGRRWLAGLVAGAKAAGSAVVLASHHAPLVEAVADRVVDLG